MKCDTLEVILKYYLKVAEGGYVNNPKDPGGPTKYGIATNYALKEAKEKGIVPKDLDVKDLTWEQVVTIYRELYWKPIKGDEIAKIDPRLAAVIFDTKVNPQKGIWNKYAKILGLEKWNIDKAIEVLKKLNKEELNNIINQFLDARTNSYKKNSDPAFKKGHLNRVDKLRNFINGFDDLMNKIGCEYPEKVRQNLNEGTRRIDPLVIDLNGDGIKLIDIKESRAMFDLSGSGFANRVGWVSPDDGFLVWDRNNNGRIDDISEMFGNSTQSGFQALISCKEVGYGKCKGNSVHRKL